jgi:hypothetical protein
MLLIIIFSHIYLFIVLNYLLLWLYVFTLYYAVCFID